MSDLKNEISSIKNRILQIETETREILKNGGLSEEKNESLINYVNSIEQSFRRIYTIKDSINASLVNLDSSNQVAKDEESNDQSQGAEFLKLKEKYNEIETSFKCVEEKLIDSENTVDKLNADFKDVSLQVKIVSF